MLVLSIVVGKRNWVSPIKIHEEPCAPRLGLGGLGAYSSLPQRVPVAILGDLGRLDLIVQCLSTFYVASAPWNHSFVRGNP